jgi:streptogramin lyase
MADRIRKINTTTSEIHAIIRTGNQLPSDAALQGIAVSANGTIYAVDSANHVLYRIFEDGSVEGVQIGDLDSSGDVSTSGLEGSDGLDARVYTPYGVAVDASDNVWLADWGNDKIRRINHGRSQTFAGGTAGDAVSDNGLEAQFLNPRGVAVDAAGIVYVADTGNHKIRKIWPSGKTVTLAGSTQGFANGQGNAAQFDTPVDVAVDAAGKVYVSDQGNSRIRRIDVDGNVTTMAGYSATGLVDGQGNTARFSSALGSIAIEPNSRTIWILDRGNQLAGIPGNVRRMTENGNVTTYSTWQSGTTGNANAIAVDNSGFLYMLEQHV